jgi:hypothetical protein
VKKVFPNQLLLGASLAALLVLAGCASTAKDFGGSWKPVNKFQDAPTEIPLAESYAFYASPMDGTLKAMLTRWAKDSGRELSYQLRSDYTLYTPVKQINTQDINAATDELSHIYAAQLVSVTATDRKILVAQAPAVTPQAAMNKETPVTASKADVPASAPASAK